MVKTIRQLEDELRDIVRREVFNDTEDSQTLEKVFKETLDHTTPEKSGDLRHDKNKDTTKKHNYWI